MAENQQAITPQKFLEDLWAARNAMVITTGVDLEVFTHISKGKNNLQQLAESTGTDRRALRMLLDSLVAIGYLNKTGEQYGLEPISATFLIKDKEPYIGAFAEETKLVWQTWQNLTQVVKSGKPMLSIDQDKHGREFFPKLVKGIFPMSFQAAKAVTQSLNDQQKSSIHNILDVAAGSGAWSLAFAQAIPESKVTAVDYEEVIPITRQFADRFRVADRYNYLEGNLREVDFGKNKYDLVILGHIIHSEGEEFGQKLIQKSSTALKDGGMLLIAEMVPNDERTAPVFPLVFALNMLINTEHGDVFTMKEYNSWLKDAGFKKVWTVEVPGPSPVILATK
jgi:ubiquinone/menaquinone biosynthesis C-methylase UbiE